MASHGFDGFGWLFMGLHGFVCVGFLCFLSLPRVAWHAFLCLGSAWLSMALHGFAWLCMALHGGFAWLLCMALHGFFAWLLIALMALHGFSWLCMALYGLA